MPTQFIDRLLTNKIRDSLKSVLLLGPRQVGKSTLIRAISPDLSINFADNQTFLDFHSNPNELNERLAAGLASGAEFRTVFLDEIQRYPELLNTVQAILDSVPNPPKFFLTGSSARKLKRGQANLLPGRIFAYQLAPLCAAELDYQLDIDRALKYGCLPEPYLSRDSDHCEKLLTTYSGVYLREEIQAEALTRNLDGFSRFIMAAAATSGTSLDFSKIAKQARIERKVCSRFFEILEDTLVATRLDVYDKTAADIVKRPRYYFFDTGVLNGLLDNFAVSEDRKGLLFEHLVINQIIASAKARDQVIGLSYFRTRGGYEVDVVVEIKEKHYAIEIKSGRIDAADARKLEVFREHDPKIDGLFIVAPKTAPRLLGTVRACELSELLRRIGL